MLQEIGGSLDKVDAWVEDALAQKKKIAGYRSSHFKVRSAPAPHLREMAIKAHRAARQAKLDPDVRRHAAISLHHGRQSLNTNVDFCSRHGLLQPRHPDGSLHADLCHRSHEQLDPPTCSSSGAKPPFSAAERMRPANPTAEKVVPISERWGSNPGIR